MRLRCTNCGSVHEVENVHIPAPDVAQDIPMGEFTCWRCRYRNSFFLPSARQRFHPTLSCMAEAFTKFSDDVIEMVDSKTTYDTGKGGNFADRMTSPVGWLHDASKYLHEVYQHCLGDAKLTKEEARRNLYKVAHCCQLAADRL